MKTKKTYRLLSAVLAILMVFAVCPMFAISAADATEQADEVQYWDGTVPGIDGTTYEVVADVLAGTTMPDYVVAKTPYYMSLAQFNEHFTVTTESGTAPYRRFEYIDVKDATGFAMLCLMTNNSFQIIDTDSENTVWFDGTRKSDNDALTVDGIYYMLNGSKDWARYRLAADIYLNDPAADRSTWHSVVPLFWRKPTTFTPDIIVSTDFSGQNHAIVGWYVKNTADADDGQATYGDGLALNGYGLIGSWYGNWYGNNIEKVAMIDAVMDLTIADGYNSMLCAGGIVGNFIASGKPTTQSWYGAANNAFTISNCVADIEINLNNQKTSKGLYWGNLINNNAEAATKNALIGGLIGAPELYDLTSGTAANPSALKKLTVTNNLVNFSGTATGTPAAIVGGLFSTVQGETRKLTTLTMTDNYVLTNLVGYDSGNSFTTSAYCSAYADTLTATSNWFYVQKNDDAQTDTLHSSMADASNKLLVLDDVISNDYFSANKGEAFASWTDVANQLPIPTVFAENALVTAEAKAEKAAIANAVIDALKANLKTAIAAEQVVEIDTAEKFYYAFVVANEVRAEDTAAAFGNLKIKLTANIDMAGYEDFPTATNIISFDGQGYVVSNLTINRTLKATDVRVGGLTDILGKDGWGNIYGCTFQNVAFVNYTLNVDATACTSQYYVGGLFGSVGADSVISNVYLEGSLNVNGNPVGDNGGRLGTFAAMTNHNVGSLGATFTNCVFVGTASAPRTVAPFMEVLGYSNSDWSAIATSSATYTDKLEITKAARQIKINNCYSLCYTVDEEGKFVNWQTLVGNNIGMQALALNSVFQTGTNKGHTLHHANSVNGYANVVDANGNSLSYLDCFNIGDVANGKYIETAWGGPDAIYTLEQFQGSEAKNAMIFNNASEWTFFEDGTPIPAVFGDNASALTVKSIEGLEKTHNSTSLLGAQIRLDKTGIRFIAEFDTSITSDYYTIEFGVLVLPKAAVEAGRTLTYSDPVALRIATTDTAKLHAYGSALANANAIGMLEGYSAIFSVLTNIPDNILNSDTMFQVIPYIAFLSPEDVAHNATVTLPTETREVSAIVYGDNPQEFSGLYLANAACADATVATADKIAICERFATVEGFNYEVVDGEVVAKA